WIDGERIGVRHKTNIAPPKLALGPRNVKPPVELLADPVHKNRAARGGQSVHAFRQKRNRDPDEKNRLDQDDRKLKVRRNSTADTIMIRPRLAAFPKTDQDKNEKSGPTGKQRAHEPVRELEDVVDLVAMFGC